MYYNIERVLSSLKYPSKSTSNVLLHASSPRLEMANFSDLKVFSLTVTTRYNSQAKTFKHKKKSQLFYGSLCFQFVVVFFF